MELEGVDKEEKELKAVQ